MKTFIKTTLSLIFVLCMVLPLTVLAATPDYKDVSPKHWAYEDAMKAEAAGLADDFKTDTYFTKEKDVSSRELFGALYALSGKGDASPTFDSAWLPDKNEAMWSADAMAFGIYKSGIIPIYYTIISPIGPPSNVVSGIPLRYGSSEFENQTNGCRVYAEGIAIDIAAMPTRSDAVVALYYYAETYLKKDVSSAERSSLFIDAEKISRGNYPVFGYSLMLNEQYLSWNWAIDAGIIEGYPDNTLRPDATITRAEFAAMLTRFMDYIK